MKERNTRICIFIWVFVLLITCLSGCHTDIRESLFKIVAYSKGPVISSSTTDAAFNKYGFEGGKVVKQDGMYYLFTTEMVGNPIWTKTKLALWTSSDKNNWTRSATLFESTGDFTGDDPRAALWSPMPTFDPGTNRWYLSYVAYNSRPNTLDGWYRNFNGKIWMAVSETPGSEGITGPYRDSLIVLEAGEDSDPWEGLMGTDSFYPFLKGGHWMAFYGSSPESVGLAKAKSLPGPWQRMTKVNPVRRSIENPMVSRLSDGSYVALFDGCGNNRKIGYMLSEDGIHWSEEVFFELEQEIPPWWGLTRTPLGLMEEGDGLYTIFFTAYNRDFYNIPRVWQINDDGVFDGYFASIGWFQVHLD